MGQHQPPLSETFPSHLSPPVAWPQTMQFYALIDSLDGKINPYRDKERLSLIEQWAKDKKPLRFQASPQSAIHRLPFNPSLKPQPVQA